jgi:uncharacterized protein (TIGR03086 family)
MPTNSSSVLIDADRRAVEATVRAVAQVTTADLARPTPCSGWTVADLLAHMTVQQDGFADAASGIDTDLARWAPFPLGESAPAEYLAACARVIVAFAESGVADRSFLLPEIRDGGRFPAVLAIGFHLVDNVVHAWDVAASLGIKTTIAPDVLAMALRVAEAVPDGAERSRPGAAFAAAVPGRSADLLDQTLRLLGRDPGWTG